MIDLQRNEEGISKSSKNAPPEEVLEGHFTDPEQAKIALIASHSSFFSGPLPPPEVLIRYNDATPDAADRIIGMAERQSAHRQELELLVTKSNIERSNQGLKTGSYIATLCLVTSGFCAYIGQATVAGILGGSTVIGLAGVFVIGKITQNKELSEKKDKNTNPQIDSKESSEKRLPTPPPSSEKNRRAKPRR
ncbi:DUF2335 domain-containing protein [Armatimonas sp.]|uniref:DUF2335 domain-containing protein n=1 Tax=Armatimonas sp. TaxID=1872638 RepID=UPI003753C374